MKKQPKWNAILRIAAVIALVAVTGFSMAACPDGNDSTPKKSDLTPIAGDYTVSENLAQMLTEAGGNIAAVTVTAKAGKSPGAVTVYYTGAEVTTYAKSAAVPQAAGTYAVTFDVAAATGWKAAAGLSAGTLAILEYVPGSFTVTFNSDGGSNAAPQIVAEGAKAAVPAVTPPTGTLTDAQMDAIINGITAAGLYKAGLALIGWFREDGITPWDFDTDTVTANITLKAKWGAAAILVESAAANDVAAALTEANGKGADNPHVLALGADAAKANSSAEYQNMNLTIIGLGEQRTITISGAQSFVYMRDNCRVTLGKNIRLTGAITGQTVIRLNGNVDRTIFTMQDNAEISGISSNYDGVIIETNSSSSGGAVHMKGQSVIKDNTTTNGTKAGIWVNGTATKIIMEDSAEINNPGMTTAQILIDGTNKNAVLQIGGNVKIVGNLNVSTNNYASAADIGFKIILTGALQNDITITKRNSGVSPGVPFVQGNGSYTLKQADIGKITGYWTTATPPLKLALNAANNAAMLEEDEPPPDPSVLYGTWNPVTGDDDPLILTANSFKDEWSEAKILSWEKYSGAQWPGPEYTQGFKARVDEEGYGEYDMYFFYKAGPPEGVGVWYDEPGDLDDLFVYEKPPAVIDPSVLYGTWNSVTWDGDTLILTANSFKDEWSEAKILSWEKYSGAQWPSPEYTQGFKARVNEEGYGEYDMYFFYKAGPPEGIGIWYDEPGDLDDLFMYEKPAADPWAAVYGNWVVASRGMMYGAISIGHVSSIAAATINIGDYFSGSAISWEDVSSTAAKTGYDHCFKVSGVSNADGGLYLFYNSSTDALLATTDLTDTMGWYQVTFNKQ